MRFVDLIFVNTTDLKPLSDQVCATIQNHFFPSQLEPRNIDIDMERGVV